MLPILDFSRPPSHIMHRFEDFMPRFVIAIFAI